MKQYLSCWKEVGTHSGLATSLKTGFGWLMDTHKMTAFRKKNLTT